MMDFMTRTEYQQSVHSPPLAQSAVSITMPAVSLQGDGTEREKGSSLEPNGRCSSGNQVSRPKQVLAYLPRSPTDTSRYRSFPQKPECAVVPTYTAEPKLPTYAKPPPTYPPLSLPDIMPRSAYKRHMSTNDIGPPFSRHRPSVCIASDLSKYRRSSLRDGVGSPRWYTRHAVSVPDITHPPRYLNMPPRGFTLASGSGPDRPPKQRCKLMEAELHQGKASTQRERQRYVTKDGKCQVNLGRIEEKGRFLSDIFTTIVDLKYRWFLFVFMMCYIVTWLIFATIYYLDAFWREDLTKMENDDWEACFQNVDSFTSALLFSVETQRTIGYGSRMVTASCPEGVYLIMAQSIVGSMIDALMVGCMFVKISRPKKRAQTLIFSQNCVVCPRDERLCLMFRIGDLRDSHMVDAKIRAILIKSRQTYEGEFLPLEQSEINLGYETGEDRLFLVEPQVICHVIDDNSPFWEMGPQQLLREQFEIIVILEGIVEATGMTCQAKTSYLQTEIIWGHRFEPCMTLEKGAFRVDYKRFHKTFEVQLPRCSAKEMEETRELEGSEISFFWENGDFCLGRRNTATEKEDNEHKEKERDPGEGFSDLRGRLIGNIAEERSTEFNGSEYNI
ncbi:G protein-activated inward rectifier potassium channel 3 [Bombina bombina]|uniref:G protein-activated inward rectifier potassium channel 3 n=1 Tax=Bombina bombina TaxID=8345 RepID=UPI00235A9144|nr:G protein-activated inward rectifier potassium channel 3 [Bombina bombina]